jgi:acetyl-CoA acetyltransferase
MAAAAGKKIFIVGAKRTPFGAFGGSLASLSATDLAVAASKAAIASAGLDPSKIDATFMGNVIQSSADAAYLSR